MRSISRRDLFKLSAAGLVGSSGYWPLLAPTRALADDSFTPFVLLVYASGGWDQTMVFDNKIGVASCAQEPGWRAAQSISGIKYVDHPNRPSVKKFFEQYGKNATIINGVNCGAMARDHAIARMFGAVPDKRFRRCDWLSFYAAMLNPAADLPHIVIDVPYMPGEYASYAVRLTTQRIAEILKPVPNADALDQNAETALAKFRNTAFLPLVENQSITNIDSEKQVTLYYQYLRHNLLGKRLRTALGAITPPVAAENLNFISKGQLAVELFKAGYTQCLSLRAGGENEWDTTRDHFARQSALFEGLFSGLNDIMTYAGDRGILNRMLIIVMSERGRSPSLSEGDGKQAWPFSSTMLWGAGLAGNMVVGASDTLLRGVPINPTFGQQTSGAELIDMRHIMAAIFLKANAPGRLILPDTQPLACILASQ